MESTACRDLAEHMAGLDKDLGLFLIRFLESRVCFRCVLMLFKEHTLAWYRVTDYAAVYERLGVAQSEALCSVCQGVNQHCHRHVETLAQKIAEQGFEFDDFKITFSISIIAYIRKILVISEAEEALGKPFPLA